MAQQTQKKPNILVIMGDDIGWFNPRIYNRGNAYEAMDQRGVNRRNGDEVGMAICDIGAVEIRPGGC